MGFQVRSVLTSDGWFSLSAWNSLYRQIFYGVLKGPARNKQSVANEGAHVTRFNREKRNKLEKLLYSIESTLETNYLH